MRRFLWGLTLVLLAAVLAGCAGDPVKEDIEAYIKVDQVVGAKYNPKMMQDYERRMANVRTLEEAVQIFGEVRTMLVESQTQIATLKPKSKEMQQWVGKMNQGFLDMIAIYDEIIIAFGSGDPDKISAIETKVNQELPRILRNIDEAEEAIGKLAKEKGVEIP